MKVLRLFTVIAISLLLTACEPKYEIIEPHNYDYEEVVSEIADRINQNITEDMTLEELGILIMKSVYQDSIIIDGYEYVYQISILPDYIKNIYEYEYNGEYHLDYSGIMTHHANEHNETVFYKNTNYKMGDELFDLEFYDNEVIDYTSFGIVAIVPSSTFAMLNVFDFGTIEQGLRAKSAYVGFDKLHWNESFSRYAFIVDTVLQSYDDKFFFFDTIFPEVLKNIEFSNMID